MEKLNDTAISDNCMKIIRQFLKDKIIPDPSHFYCSRWNTNKFVGGAYSFTSKNTDHIEDWEKVLSQPIISGENLVLFAGEAAHEQYFSTIHGAFLSGIQQAKTILKFSKNFIFQYSKL